MSDGFTRPFSCGTEYGDWVENNCRRCALGRSEHTPVCEIDHALLMAMFGRGVIPERIGERLGTTGECPERIEEDEAWKGAPSYDAELLEADMAEAEQRAEEYSARNHAKYDDAFWKKLANDMKLLPPTAPPERQ